MTAPKFKRGNLVIMAIDEGDFKKGDVFIIIESSSVIGNWKYRMQSPENGLEAAWFGDDEGLSLVHVGGEHLIDKVEYESRPLFKHC
jgi:hypothetical protein